MLISQTHAKLTRSPHVPMCGHELGCIVMKSRRVVQLLCFVLIPIQDSNLVSKRKFMVGELRDGVLGYRQFAIELHVAWEDPVHTQVAAVSELSAYPKLDAGAHVTRSCSWTST